jgi:hypothetical protein
MAGKKDIMAVSDIKRSAFCNSQPKYIFPELVAMVSYALANIIEAG